MEDLTANIVKKKMRYSVAPENESWRVAMASELMDENIDVPGFSEACLLYTSPSPRDS